MVFVPLEFSPRSELIVKDISYIIETPKLVSSGVSRTNGSRRPWD